MGQVPLGVPEEVSVRGGCGCLRQMSESVSVEEQGVRLLGFPGSRPTSLVAVLDWIDPVAQGESRWGGTWSATFPSVRHRRDHRSRACQSWNLGIAPIPTLSWVGVRNMRGLLIEFWVAEWVVLAVIENGVRE